MTKYILLISLLLTAKANGQNCPTGYEERTVKCNGQFVKKCVLIGYSCSQCWGVQYPPCPSNKDGGLDLYNSYEKALAAAQKEANGSNWSTGKCLWYDNRTFKIYLDDSKQCNISFGGNSAAINDLKNKIIPFLKRYKAEISNYRRYFSGQSYRPGAVYSEYQSILKQSEENANKLSLKLNTITDENLSQIEQEFINLQNDKTLLIQADINYKNSITNANTSKDYASTSQPANIKMAKEKFDLLAQKQAQIKQSYDVATSLISNITDMLQKSLANKYLREIQVSREKQLMTLQNKLGTGEYEILYCDACKSTGILSHVYCNGKGETSCTSCRGSGKGLNSGKCSLCQGKGSQYCARGCAGTGVIICTTCSGTGVKLIFVNLQANNLKPSDYSNNNDGDNINNEQIKYFHAQTIDKKQFSISEYPDKSILFIFWASDNQESINEYKFHCSNYALYLKNNVILVGVAAETSRYKWISIVNDFELGGINISDLEGYNSEYFKLFKVETLPYSILVDKNLTVKQSSKSLRLQLK